MATGTGMKMGRADKAEIDNLFQFLQDLESAEERDEYWNAARDDVIEIPDDERDDEAADARLVEFVRKNISKIRGFERIVFGYEMLVDNCCDKTLGHLEWRPDVISACTAAGIDV